MSVESIRSGTGPLAPAGVVTTMNVLNVIDGALDAAIERLDERLTRIQLAGARAIRGYGKNPYNVRVKGLAEIEADIAENERLEGLYNPPIDTQREGRQVMQMKALTRKAKKERAILGGDGKPTRVVGL